ncbi:hypothetical protein Nm8I071_25280 [Nonomuraea sp. TT08I-71]|nr:hypothetical protein Nm8I071_25280 [Nonomuraea sp. TT08I-71]
MRDPGEAGHIRHRGTPHGTHPPRQAPDHDRRSTPEPRDAPSEALHPPRLSVGAAPHKASASVRPDLTPPAEAQPAPVVHAAQAWRGGPGTAPSPPADV